MRCIEMIKISTLYVVDDRLIETWDVLKSNRYIRNSTRSHLINRNMRCIEMSVTGILISEYLQINRNMRCIEIAVSVAGISYLKGLIETWDVLKWFGNYWIAFNIWINRNMRCIEIIEGIIKGGGTMLINRNMRCIEIYWLSSKGIMAAAD